MIGCEHGARSSAHCNVPGCGSYDGITYEIEIFDVVASYGTCSCEEVWYRDDCSYSSKADAEWMARYLELVKGKGRTRVVEVKRKAV